MINRQANLHFQAKKFQSNAFCRFNQLIADEQYILPESLAKRSLQDKNNKWKDNNKQNILSASSEIIDLEDLWQTVQNQNKEQQKTKIIVSTLNMQPDDICQFTLEQFQALAKPQHNQELSALEQLKKGTQEQPQDLGDLWQVVQKETTQNENKNNKDKCQEQIKKEQENVAIVDIKKKEGFDLDQLLNSRNDKSLNYNISKDYLIYDYHKFVVSIFETNIHSYFGFQQSPTVKNTYYLYNLITKEKIIECFIDKCDQLLFASINNKNKVDYQTQFCMKFRLPKANHHFATAFHKYINNGILYNLKPYNSYENQYEDSFALIQINDGFIGSNCYCNTNVFISQKYTTQPGQLKMNITMKNGFLIANMGVNGVKSAPYNCRLQNFQSNFVYLLGLVDKESKQFIVRVGEGMSPLIAFGISVGRKRYIDSFTQ